MILDIAMIVMQEEKRLYMHDPLCFEFDNKDSDGFDHSLESPFCYCELINKIRADERDQALSRMHRVMRVIETTTNDFALYRIMAEAVSPNDGI